MTFSAFVKYLTSLAAVVMIIAGLGVTTGTGFVSTVAQQKPFRKRAWGLERFDFWRAVRHGERVVSIPDTRAGVLVQSGGGKTGGPFRNGPLSVFGAWALFGIIILLCVFFILRGRIKVEHGLQWEADRTLQYR